MRFPTPPDDDEEDDDSGWETKRLPPFFPSSGWAILALLVSWLAMLLPVFLQLAFNTRHVVASVEFVKLIFDISSWACWLTVPLAGYAAWYRPAVLYGITLLAALIGIYVHLSITHIGMHSQ